MNRTIVIHGVGGAEPGRVASDVASSLGMRIGEVKKVWSDGCEFVEIVDIESRRAVVEVNWSDLVSPVGVLGVIKYLLYVLTSMVDVASQPKMRAAVIYRALLFTVTPGAVFLVLAVSAAFVIENNATRRLALMLLLSASSVLTLYLRRLGSHFHYLWLLPT
jgi:hypothetical protein